MHGKNCGEEAARRGDIPALGDEYVEDLAVLVQRPIDVPPHSGDLDGGLVDEPPVPNRVPERAGRIDQLRGESLDPPEQGDVIDVDAALMRAGSGPRTKGRTADNSAPPAGSRQEGNGTPRTPKEHARAASGGDGATPRHPHRPRAIRQRNTATPASPSRFTRRPPRGPVAPQRRIIVTPLPRKLDDWIHATRLPCVREASFGRPASTR
jgi:hypothetical protein